MTERAIRERKKKRGYIHDPRTPGGALKGVCYVKYDRRVTLYPPFPVELEGDNAIRKPEKGEQRYYEARKPAPLVYLGRYASPQKRYGVHGAVIMLRDVEAGCQGDFDRVRYQVDYRNHQIVPAVPEGRGVFNPSGYGVGLMRVKQLLQVLNLCLYECHLVLTHIATGRKVWEGTVKGYHDPNFPGEHIGSNPRMARPSICQIPRIDQKGIYRLTCKRHPWQRAYLVLWDSPYLTVSRGAPTHGRPAPERAGEFEIAGIPAGEHTVEVWHPEYEPVKKTHKVSISMDQVTALSVEFKAPPVLKAAPEPRPEKPIVEWAFVGPFYPLMDEEPDAPNKKLDFAATYDGMFEEVGWKRIKTESGRDSGYVRLHKAVDKVPELCLSYFAVQIEVAKAARLYLQVHNEANSLRIWLNGKVMFRSYTGDFRHAGRRAGWFILSGDLKAGTNTLLLLVSAERAEHARFSVRYLAEGASLKVPVK